MKDEHYDQWLKDLKVGDQVVVEQNYISTTLSLSKVVRITPKGYHRIQGLESLLFKDGFVSPGAHTYRMLKPTAERIDKINLVHIRKTLRDTNWSRIDDDVVRKVWDLIRESEINQ